MRASAMRRMAARLGLNYFEAAIPRVNLEETPFNGLTAARNVLEGQRCGVVVIAFDCQVGEGKGSWRRTVIAAQTHEDILALSHSIQI